MNLLRSTLPFVALVVALPTLGCTVTKDGNKVTGETDVLFEGDDVSQSGAYDAGGDVRVVTDNGSITVVRGGGDEVSAVFSPSCFAREQDEDEAIDQMNTKLQLEFSQDGGNTVIRALKKSGASGKLAADVKVTLPADFDGDLVIDQGNGSTDVDLSGTEAASTTIASDNGSVNLVGARGKLSIATDNGSIDVRIAAWSAENGSITSGNGDVSVALPAGADGSMTALAEGPSATIIEPDPFPSDWVAAGEGASKSYTMGDGEGGRVDIATELGDITFLID